ncbi:RtcB family protein [Candidatus Acetothermia bacterium]|nr:RtcB family protein [Candidatus Acetothermia bacterium]
MGQIELKQLSDYVWEIPPQGGMKVPARIFASEALLQKMQEDDTLKQACHMAHMPGIYKYSITLPDAHQGYGFPVGGVAALDTQHGAISPGGIGYDINCGVRICKSNLTISDLKSKEEQLVDLLFSQIPSGIGKGSIVGKLSKTEIDDVARRGVAWALDRGLAVASDLEHCEDTGVRPGADPSKVSNDANERAQEQLGSLGSGNHFVEVQRVADIFDEKIAQHFGLFKDQIVFTIHCGSRGYGHQICTDYLKYIEREHRDLLNSLPDRQLACAPAGSRLAEDYYAAMNCGINFAWTNRQLIMWRARECFEKVFHKSWQELQMNLLYDVAHNIGKKEVHSIEGKLKEVYVHRKGATRSFPAGRRELPKAFQNIGQPVIIPGSMGTGTYILVGSQIAMDLTFGSTAHGAGRLMSRSRATREYRADKLVQELKERGIYVRGQSKATIAEEAPGAYKDLDEVVRVSHEVGIGQKVARLIPICNIKG